MSLYVTASEFRAAPTGVNVDNLDYTNIGNTAAQDAQLTNILRVASQWVDNLCRMTGGFKAQTITETKEVNMLRDGRTLVYPNNAPIINVSSVQYRFTPNTDFSTLDLALVQQYNDWFTIFGVEQVSVAPLLTLQYQYFNPFQFQRLSYLPMVMKYTYTYGFADTIISVAATAGANTVTVTDTTGITQGTSLTISDGVNTEYVNVQSVNGNIVTLSGTLLFNHAINIRITAIPEAIRQATILLAGFLVKERGSMAITMAETSVQSTSISYNRFSEFDVVKQLLKPYMRVVAN